MSSLRPEGGGAARGWALTERGLALQPVLRAAADWGMEHTKDETRADSAAVRRRIGRLG